MPVDIAHYHGWRGSLRSPWFGTLAMVRVALMQVFRRKAYWAVLALGLLNFLLFWALIYIPTQLASVWPRASEQILDFFDFNAHPAPDKESGYISFMWRQSIVVMILLAFSGSLLVGADFRLNTLPFYLSRRIDRSHYIAGKLLAISALVALLTVVPALALFVEYGLFTSNLDYWLTNWRIPLSVVGYGLVLAVVMSTLLAALSAYLERTAPIAITWSFLFLALSIMAGQLREATGNRYWNLIDPWRDMRYVGRLCFGNLREGDEDLAWWALAILVTVCTAALAALVHRVRAVEVVE